MITIGAERSLPASADAIIDRIWARTEWHALHSSVKGLAIEYDDGRHQSVQVCLASQSGFRSVSLIRFRDSVHRISFFYSRLPQGFTSETGIWEADATDTGCCLRLLRNLQLERRRMESDDALQAREAAYGKLLTEHLGRTIEALIVT